MNTSLSSFKPQHQFLICVDSDGCGMDTMTIKHEQAFGPAILDVWPSLEPHRDNILKRWNDFNLYEITRGINRFKGLNKMLTELHNSGITVEGYEDIKHWVETTPIFSNPELMRAIFKNPNQHGLKLMLDWSNKVNERIEALPSVGPFPHVHSALNNANQFADIAIVSSANLSAVDSEWTAHGLTQYVTGMFAQEAGTKEHCINTLKAHYDNGCVLMIGDAKGDLDAAKHNDVYFYPILAGHEGTSWQAFNETYAHHFQQQTFSNIQQQLIEQFYSNFK
ncbi:HAD family hydrolase [Staphylococcus americanisciuri]|uniref:HAD hydrolase-like protein n=1 Tax=Staphylococcus americanisciuri TaxID=2973940 RepID=A0ABT2F320_9STAP|nr:HAD hydrolase-like protein [Staphylococcus americanisciuri]MCS4486568.1 HAD hydrolase-like protein [Staphylococcus americanisciuri]